MAISIQRNVLLNPGPANTTETVKQALVVPDTGPREREFRALLARVRRRLVEVVHGGDAYEAVIFAGTGTAALEACICSLVPRQRTLMVVENGGYGERMREIAGVYGLPVVSYRVPWGEPLDLVEIGSLLRRHHDDVSHLAVVHHETTTGALNPIAQCASLVHRYGVEIIVDAMSSYAGLPINVAEQEIDYLIASSSKCIQGMAGLSFVICRRDALQAPRQAAPRSFYLDLYAQYRLFEDVSCMRFTAPVQLLYALDQALREYFQETEQGRHRRYVASYEELVQGLRRLGFRLLLPAHQHSRLVTAVIEPTHPAYCHSHLHDFVRERGFTIYPKPEPAIKAFRLANIGQIDRDDVRAFLNVLEQYLIEHGLMGQLYD